MPVHETQRSIQGVRGPADLTQLRPGGGRVRNELEDEPDELLGRTNEGGETLRHPFEYPFLACMLQRIDQIVSVEASTVQIKGPLQAALVPQPCPNAGFLDFSLNPFRG